MPLPLYYLRHLVMPSGIRLPKLQEAQDVAGICPTCSKAVIRKRMMGVLQVDGMYSRGEHYHYNCVPPFPYGSQSSDGRIPKGNLPQEEYRFWVGCDMTHSDFAICRCCRMSTYGSKLRAEHFANEKLWVAGESCSVRLVNAYKLLLNQPECIVCKRNRFQQSKWGVPLCEQPFCEREWKFGQTKWLSLEVHLDMQKKKAEFLQRRREEKPMVALGPTCKMRPWCSQCHMFEDNEGHKDIHAIWVRSYHDE